jgi:hypothetical protein
MASAAATLMLNDSTNPSIGMTVQQSAMSTASSETPDGRSPAPGQGLEDTRPNDALPFHER